MCLYMFRLYGGLLTCVLLCSGDVSVYVFFIVCMFKLVRGHCLQMCHVRAFVCALSTRKLTLEMGIEFV